MCQHVTTCHFCEATYTVVANVILDMYTSRTSWNHYRHWNMPAPGTFDNPPCAHVHNVIISNMAGITIRLFTTHVVLPVEHKQLPVVPHFG